MTGTEYSVEVKPRLPEALARLEELANDLFYTWSGQVRSLFIYLDRKLWRASGHSPKLFLRWVSQERLDEAVHDRTFMEAYARALSEYDSYHAAGTADEVGRYLDPNLDLVAYFCLEFGFHESIPIYSGGLGILAGDHCKAASDYSVPLVAVGLLYRQGYFNQRIDRNGNQIPEYPKTLFTHLPVQPVVGKSGKELRVCIELPGRDLRLRVWEAKVGRIRLYLLDSDLPENEPADRAITYQLYGGDKHMRIQQEIVLGIGGVRTLRSMGLEPSAWHVNEGHGAFQVLERCRYRVEQGLDFDAALELVAGGTVFTTHTPVPAGHDVFDHGLFAQYFTVFCEQLGIDMERLLSLGSSPSNQGGFNMTALALRGSRFHNGVSEIHGRVAARMEAYIWPELPAKENPIRHVTNGVHVPTFLAPQWQNLFDMQFGREWRNQLLNKDYWARIDEVPDFTYWSVRQALKAELLRHVHERVVHQCERNGYSPLEIERMTRFLTPRRADVLVIGFARRFATYKRAMLLFRDPQRLARLLGDADRPVIVLIAGKAHPSDIPGQELIRSIHALSMKEEFQGKVLLLEDYNLGLARWLVSGVDVWLNTPEYPLEASGTSGQKAGINGVVNLSVLDGWWGEGYNGHNGWAIKPHPQVDKDERDHMESRSLLEILEQELIPRYYDRDGHGFSTRWVEISKASMKSIMPRFNAGRMMMDYVRDFYAPAARQRGRLIQQGARGARELAEWKQRVLGNWHHVQARRVDEPVLEMDAGTELRIEVAVRAGDLRPEDLVVECLVGRKNDIGEFVVKECCALQATGVTEGGELLFSKAVRPPLPGLQYYRLRIFPYHELLTHRFELGLMRWL